MPREGHDIIVALSMSLALHFNPRAPRGARQKTTEFTYNPIEFQSTCPARGTTCNALKCVLYCSHFNPRAPRGARPFPDLDVATSGEFQSTCPARGTTQYSPVLPGLHLISIHVPREGHDQRPKKRCRAGRDFNPRAPRGARLAAPIAYFAESNISIHVPREGHDLRRGEICPPHRISIHVPREGHDPAA